MVPLLKVPAILKAGGQGLKSNPALLEGVLSFFFFLFFFFLADIGFSDSLDLTQGQCLAKGGKWGRFGLMGMEQCNLPTADVGKTCFNQNECEGACIAQLTKEEEEQAEQGKGIKIAGKCSEWTLNFGCYPFVQNGRVDGILCLD